MGKQQEYEIFLKIYKKEKENNPGKTDSERLIKEIRFDITLVEANGDFHTTSFNLTE